MNMNGLLPEANYAECANGYKIHYIDEGQGDVVPAGPLLTSGRLFNPVAGERAFTLLHIFTAGDKQVDKVCLVDCFWAGICGA